ncbi:hypothetical protein [Luteolibacter arcticus]|nr:hypothetical protein [Luteolibacter arcticus]
MWIVRASLLLAVALVVNHLLHGWDCWGRRPGGWISMGLYAGQLAVAGIGSVVAMERVRREGLPGGSRAALRIAVFAAVAAVAFFLGGWMAFTSARYQQPYVLLAFGAAWVSGMVAGAAWESARRQVV